MVNISKKRRFPEWEYFVYDLNKRQRGVWINIWFKMEDWLDKKKKPWDRDEYWTLIKVDETSVSHLYNRYYNPLSLRIADSYHRKGSFDLCARIHSIDDASYGVWFNDDNKEKLKLIRLDIMEWVDKHKIINGNEFLDFCVSIGADPKTKDYD